MYPGAVAVLETQPSSEAMVATDARPIPPERTERTVRAKIEVEIDLPLLLKPMKGTIEKRVESELDKLG